MERKLFKEEHASFGTLSRNSWRRRYPHLEQWEEDGIVPSRLEEMGETDTCAHGWRSIRRIQRGIRIRVIINEELAHIGASALSWAFTTTFIVPTSTNSQ